MGFPAITMITSFLLTILKDLVDVVLYPFSLLPDVSIDPNLAAAITNIKGMLSTLAPILPMLALLTTLGIIFSIEIGIFVYKGIMWLIKKIPTIS